MSIEAMKQAVVALDDALGYGSQRLDDKLTNAITSLRQAIEQAEKPTAWQWLNTAHFRKKLPKDAEKGAWNPLYAAPQPQREWVGLTDEEIKKFWRDATVKPCYTSELIDTFAKAIEAKLKEKNT